MPVCVLYTCEFPESLLPQWGIVRQSPVTMAVCQNLGPGERSGYMGVCHQNQGYRFGVPNYNVLGSIVESPVLGNYHIWILQRDYSNPYEFYKAISDAPTRDPIPKP